MRFSTFHTHTCYSDGKNTPEEMLTAAIAKGFAGYGFSDHSFTPCDTSYCMKLERYPEYISCINGLKEKYAGQIEVLCGIENDYYSDTDPEDFDYMIGSVHYLVIGGTCYPIDHSERQQRECIAKECGGSAVEMAKRYYEKVAEHIRRTKPEIVGHFDVITKFGVIDETSEEYRRAALEAADEALNYTRIFEVNTGAISRGYKKLPYPSDFILRRVLERGGDVILSSDTHSAATIDTFFPESVELLRGIGFRRLAVMTANGVGYTGI